MLVSPWTRRSSFYQSAIHVALKSAAAVKFRPQRRCISSEIPAASEKLSFRALSFRRPDDDFIKAASWLAPNASNVEPTDVLQELAKIGQYPASALTSIVFLATPSFTHWFDEKNDFLRQAVQQLSNTYGSRNHVPKTIRTRSAIVDRIPSDASVTTRIEGSNTGHEGISVLMSGKSLHKLRSYKKPYREGDDLGRHIRFVSETKDGARNIVALPVANTLFRNGHHHTLFEDTWRSDAADSESPRFQRLSRESIIAFDIATTSPGSSPYIGMPILPLTRPREIISSMGNVIRELKDSDSGKSFPASTELELAVSTFLKTPWLNEATKRNFTVYALTAKKNLYELASEDIVMGRHPPSRRHLLRALLSGSAQMHRVTGGGGGWGSKKGLLSLAPGEDILTDYLMQQSNDPQEIEDQNLRSPSAPVHPGDNVQFFAVVPGPQFPPTEEPPEVPTFKEVEAARVDAWRSKFPRVIIGTNPPEEQYPIASIQPFSTEDKLVSIPNCFGMLSESGTCLGCASQDSSSGRDVVAFSSRLDIPYTTIVLDASLRYRGKTRGDQKSRPLYETVKSPQNPK